MPPGTYTLIVSLARPTTVRVGALGDHRFEAGWYAYTGSAFGPGGLSRIDRHRDVAEDERDTRHWHVDYLLGHEAARVERVVAAVDRECECAVARSLDAVVPGFGSSDCDCPSHLAFAPTADALRAAVEAACADCSVLTGRELQFD